MAHDIHSSYIQQEIERRANSWYLFLNEIFGIAGFGLALGAIGTDSPQFYASIILIFLFLIYVPEAYRRRIFIKTLREERHPALGLLSTFRAGSVYLFGLLFLLLVMLGALDKTTTWASIWAKIP